MHPSPPPTPTPLDNSTAKGNRLLGLDEAALRGARGAHQAGELVSGHAHRSLRRR